MGSLFKKKKKQEPGQLPPELFEQLCRDGERADILVGQGKADEGQEILGSIFKRMFEAKAFDEFLLAKLCLSNIIGSIAGNRTQMAYAIWTGTLPGAPGQIYKIGINGIETGVLEVRDTLIYQHTGAFLHACGTDLQVATRSVNGVMSSVLKGAREYNMDFQQPLISHWKYCLARIYDDDPAPPDLMSQLEREAKAAGLTVPERGKLVLLRPSEWKTDAEIIGQIG